MSFPCPLAGSFKRTVCCNYFLCPSTPVFNKIFFLFDFWQFDYNISRNVCSECSFLSDFQKTLNLWYLSLIPFGKLLAFISSNIFLPFLPLVTFMLNCLISPISPQVLCSVLFFIHFCFIFNIFKFADFFPLSCCALLQNMRESPDQTLLFISHISIWLICSFPLFAETAHLFL